ncbi:unnamed protein product [Auanema sp. JU1783]|nr:unnamed protein product [Auanema sp. JU1783]
MSNERAQFIPKPTGQSSFKLRFLQALRVPKYKTIPAFFLAVGIYLVSYNGVVRLCKGPDHPLNKFGWDQMKARNELPPELLIKEKVLNEYYKSRIYEASDSPPPSIGY